MCNFISQKQIYYIGQFALSSLWDNISGKWADSTIGDKGKSERSHFVLRHLEYTVDYLILNIVT